MQYKINEVFETIQGEGAFTGQPSVFVRLQACPVACSWCDTKHTWEVDESLQIPAKDLSRKSQATPQWAAMTVDELLALVIERGYQAKHLVITGGEPCMVDLMPLTEGFEVQGYSCQVETSGTFAVQISERSWVTVSPKINMRGGYKVLASALERANEIKHPVATQQHVDELKHLLDEHQITDKPIYLQPISQKSRATQLAIKTCISNNWRLSVQVHKYLGIE